MPSGWKLNTWHILFLSPTSTVVSCSNLLSSSFLPFFSTAPLGTLGFHVWGLGLDSLVWVLFQIFWIWFFFLLKISIPSSCLLKQFRDEMHKPVVILSVHPLLSTHTSIAFEGVRNIFHVNGSPYSPYVLYTFTYMNLTQFLSQCY